MPTYDLHGLKRDEAMEFVEKIIGKIRLESMGQIETTIRIITGHGVIRMALMDYLKENDLDYHVEWGNPGAFIVEVC